MQHFVRRGLRFLALPQSKRALVLQAAILLVAMRVGLKAMRLATLRRLLTALASPNPTAAGVSETRIADVVWAVETASRQLPAFGTCLTQALAAHVLLGRSGTRSDLRIGVMRRADGEFIAHAWLERSGTIVIGGLGHASYTPMPPLNGLDPQQTIEART